MKRKFPAVLVASHAVVILLGLWLARLPSPAAAKDADVTGSNNKSASSSFSSSGPSSSGKSSSFAPTGQWKGTEYARAWKAVRTAKLSRPDRVRVQRELLAKWAEVDLTAAIEASLGEAWDDDPNRVFGGGTGQLFDVFGDAFAKNPKDTWELIRSKQFGVASGILRDVWLNTAGRKDPAFLAGIMGEISWRDQSEALQACRMGLAGKTKEERDAVFKRLAAYPESLVPTSELVNFAGFQGDASPEALKQEILQLVGSDERLAKVKGILLGREMNGHPPSEIAAAVQGIPDAVGQEVIWSAFKQRNDPGDGIALMDLLVEKNAWAKIQDRATIQRLQMMARNGEAGAATIAEWAATMPVRPETTEVFHRSVDTFVRNDTPEAREWMASLPPGVWRDRAYAEFSQQSLNGRNDPAASQWALDQIGNPAFKNEATGWRRGWEQRTGWKAN